MTAVHRFAAAGVLAARQGISHAKSVHPSSSLGYLLVLFATSAGLLSGPVLAVDSESIENALSGSWVAWEVKSNAVAQSGLISIAFRFQGTNGSGRNVVTWETVVDGKRTARMGTFTIEKSDNLFFPPTTTWCVKIRDISTDYSADAIIHLVNVRVQADNRVGPVTEAVLKFRDAFYTDFIFRREAKKGQADRPPDRSEPVRPRTNQPSSSPAAIAELGF